MTIPMTSTLLSGIHCRVPADPFEVQRREALVCLHGLGGSGRQLLSMADAVGRRLSPVLIDLPGHGASECSCPREPEVLVETVLAAIDDLGLQKTPWLFGHSFGGLVALKAALMHPHRFAGLILVATAPRLRLHPDLLERVEVRRFDLEWVRANVGADVDEDCIRLQLEDFTRMNCSRTTLESWMRVDLRVKLGDITDPVLVVQPTADIIISPRNSIALAEALPKARLLVLPGAGHYVTLSRPTLLGHGLVRFVEEAAPISSTPQFAATEARWSGS